MYTTKVTATGGRNGRVTSEDGILDFSIKIPKEMGGPGGEYTNPEQLFAAGYAACFDSALQFVILKEGLKQKETSVEAEVSLHRKGLEFDLSVKLTVRISDVDLDTAKMLTSIAHATCPYSKATKGNINVELEVIDFVSQEVQTED
ncbi:organic hydroperoxide resistance protein [Mangrovibacterium diazotrophicum]|uniref:Ohr subfamily peroxiredoxin n=1 Tax=Mangrovibacterium diazotrophicum TaxID=1261403 RepID=A0A419W368_9BACT|nr:organic hydroperoxide resistance protein [Mangrovibacterium diazotrophicum]RKD89903.1 Ohr subfamily peroxiredoxin [Mangrovibacterium diazotrophicum]